MGLYIELRLGLKLVREYRPLRRRLGWLTVPCTKYESTLTSMRQLVLYKVDQVLLLLLHLILIFNIGLGRSRWGRRYRGH